MINLAFVAHFEGPRWVLSHTHTYMYPFWHLRFSKFMEILSLPHDLAFSKIHVPTSQPLGHQAEGNGGVLYNTGNCWISRLATIHPIAINFGMGVGWDRDPREELFTQTLKWKSVFRWRQLYLAMWSWSFLPEAMGPSLVWIWEWIPSKLTPFIHWNYCNTSGIQICEGLTVTSFVILLAAIPSPCSKPLNQQHTGHQVWCPSHSLCFVLTKWPRGAERTLIHTDPGSPCWHCWRCEKNCRFTMKTEWRPCLTG